MPKKCNLHILTTRQRRLIVASLAGVGICRGFVIHGASNHLADAMYTDSSDMLNQLSPFIIPARPFYDGSNSFTVSAVRALRNECCDGTSH